MSDSQSINSRILLSKVLIVLSVLLYLGTYTLGPLFEYIDPVTKEVEFDPENLSFQPFKFLMPDGLEEMTVPPEQQKYLGKVSYEFFPEGIYAYLIGYKTMPIWRVSLEAPQYPKASYPEGIPVYFTLTDFRGQVVEMNVINHYIGMDPMEVGAFKVRKMVPFLIGGALLCLMVSLFYSGPFWWILTLGPSAFPWIYMGTYIYWLYWFGHNLHSYGAFTIKPFMPTVIGDGKVAQFTTHSYPAVGFYFLFFGFILIILSTLIKRKALKEKKETIRI
ncbi:MAG: cytochrome C [Bacteriovoracaceae bacterium]|nr:cytochrome C [Bacteriovoracaceae bacterium]